MNAKKTLIVALTWAASLLLSCAGAWAWQRTINGTASGSDWANVVAVDALGNVGAAGTTYNTGTGKDFTVVKLPRIAPNLLELTADLKTPQNLGATVTLTGTASDGFAPLQYKWWMFNGVAWTVVKNWSTSSSFTRTAGLDRYYRIGAWVKRNFNPADAPENNAFAGVDFTVNAPLE